MPSYRLLRSNKESGPYALNDLVALGLKPYDLVWVDGRSAAWRYPSEITELKEYAPAVEEQPYDRNRRKTRRALLRFAFGVREHATHDGRAAIRNQHFRLHALRVDTGNATNRDTRVERVVLDRDA